jgi:hypothetical protein
MKRTLAAACATFALAAAAAPADGLLKLARDGASVDPGYVHRDAVALLGALGASAELRERFDRAGGWNVRRLMPGERLESISDAIVVARGNAYIASAGRAIVIAANDVEIEDGGDVLVVAGGNIRFRQSRLQPWAGVFVSRGSFDAPWLSHAAVAPGRGVQLTHYSRDVLFYNTALPQAGSNGMETRFGPSLFDGVRAMEGSARRMRETGDFRFAGQLCEPQMTMKDISPVPEMAKRKLPCGAIDDAIVTCDVPRKEDIWTLHGCTNWMSEIIARRKAGAVEIVYAPPPSPQSSQAMRVEPKPLAPGECPPTDGSPRCALARIVKGEEAYPAPKLECPEPRAATQGLVDQLKSDWKRGTGMSWSKAGGIEAASFFELVKKARIAQMEWSGAVESAEQTFFIIRIYRDADGMPGPLVKDVSLVGMPQEATDVRFSLPRGKVYMFRANTPAIELAAGRYWLSILEPPTSTMRFMWSTERDAKNVCGSGGISRKSEKDAWTPIWPEVAPRRTRGYSFSLTLVPL